VPTAISLPIKQKESTKIVKLHPDGKGVYNPAATIRIR